MKNSFHSNLCLLISSFMIAQFAFADAETATSLPSEPFKLNADIEDQPFFFQETEPIFYSGKFQTYDTAEAKTLKVTVTTDGDTTVLKEVSPTQSGSFELRPADYSIGYHLLKHNILNSSGEVLASMEKEFLIFDSQKYEFHFEELSQDATWSSNKIHIIWRSFCIRPGVTLTIEPGAIVKFRSNVCLDIASCAVCIANNVIFTHINDDSVGGDVLNDGPTNSPMDCYTIKGDLVYNENSELRFLTIPDELPRTITKDLRLVSNRVYTANVVSISGGSLTIPPGTILKMKSGRINIEKDGCLKAIGTRVAPIIITSFKDDSVGGDTNNDGDSTVPYAGDWINIQNLGTLNLSYVSVLYGGPGDNLNNGSSLIHNIVGNTLIECCIVKHSNHGLLRSDGGTTIARNCILEDGYYGVLCAGNNPSLSLVNSVIANCTIGSDQAIVKNSIFWQCGRYSQRSSISKCIAYGDNISVQDGFLYANPLFLDPENGDYRITENSPCIDAADTNDAPDFDYYGQPRVSFTKINDEGNPLADIGIYELIPKNFSGKVDLVPQSIIADNIAIPGKNIKIKWLIKNDGKYSIDEKWRDTISLVTDYGKEIKLGDYVVTTTLANGKSLECSGVFTVPALSEGTYYPKVNLNSYHDVFEGILSTNNALIGKQPISIVLEGFDHNESGDGTLEPGTPKIIKLRFDESDEKRMIRFTLPNGVKVSWGFGFMPDSSYSSGSTTAGDQDVVFLVPKGSTDVYIVLESDKSASYKYSSENASMVITSVSPKTLPSSGTTTLTITGGGFGQKSTVTLLDSSGNIELGEYSSDASGSIYATVDCAKLRQGITYGLKVTAEEVSATLYNAVAVTRVASSADLVAKLDAPDIIRRGRIIAVYIDYENKGNIDLPAPIFEIISQGQIFTVDDVKYTNSVKVVGLSKRAPVGMLHPNEPQRLGVKVTIMTDKMVSWELQSYYAGQESAKTTRFSLRELYNDDWVVYHESEDEELLSKLRKAVGSKWADFYTNFGLWLSDIKPNITNYETLKSIFGEYQYLKATGKFDSYEYNDDDEEDENKLENKLYSDNLFDSTDTNTEGNGPNSCNHVLACPKVPEKAEEFEWKKYPRNGSVWRFCRKCQKWALAVQGSNTNGKHEDDETYCKLDSYNLNQKKKTYIIIHGNANDLNGGFKEGEQWAHNIAMSLPEDADVLGVNWGVGACQVLNNPGGEFLIVDLLASAVWEAIKFFVNAVTLGQADLKKNLMGSACYIPETVYEVIRGLDELNLNPANTTIIAHSHGAHIGANVITHWEEEAKNNQNIKFARFVGLDVSTTDNGVHAYNMMDPDEWIEKIKDCCSQVEFYKSSWDMSLEKVDQVFGHFNFALMRGEGDFWEFEALGLGDDPEHSGFTLDPTSTMEVNRHGWAHKWFLKTIKKPSKYKNLGFMFEGWQTLRNIAGNDIKFPGESFEDSQGETQLLPENIFAGVIRENTLELLSCRKKNGELLPKWRYDDVVLKTQGEDLDKWFNLGRHKYIWWFPIAPIWETKSFMVLKNEWAVTVENDIRVTLPKPNQEGKVVIDNLMGFYVNVYNHADNLSVDYDTLLKNGNKYSTALKEEHGAVNAWLVDIEGIKEKLGYEPKLDDIYDLVEALKKLKEKDKPENYYRDIGEAYMLHDFAYPQGEAAVIPGEDKKGSLLTVVLHPYVFDKERPLAVLKDGGQEVDHYRDVMLVISSGNVTGLHDLTMLPQWDLYWPNNFIMKRVEAHPGDGFPVISKTKGQKSNVSSISGFSLTGDTPKLSMNALKPGEVVPVTADKNGNWSVALDSSESYLLSGGKFTVNIFELPDSGDDPGDARFHNGSKKCEFIQVTVSGQLPQDTDADGNLLCEGKKYTVQLTVSTEGIEPKTTYCILDVRASDDDDEGKDEDRTGSSYIRSYDPNEMIGPIGLGNQNTQRFVIPGEWLNYTVCFENTSDATAAAQEVRVNNPLSEYLDWETFEMCDIAFNNQIDLGLSGKQSGTSEVEMTGTNYIVRTELELDKEKGEANWYMRIVDPSTDTGWPNKVEDGFLPPNDETHCGEGHLSYRIKVREDTPGGALIRNSASIIFDYNDPIETDPSWWNKVAKTQVISIGDDTNATFVVGLPYGELPTPEPRETWIFVGWYTGSNGTGRLVTKDSLVEEGDTALYQYWIRDGHYLDKEDETNADADTYNGYVFDPNDRSIKGSVQVKVANPKGGNAKVTGSIIWAGGIKDDIKESMVMSTSRIDTKLKNGRPLTLIFSSNGLTGTLDSFEISGSRNVFVSKDPNDKAIAEAALSKVKGVYTLAWEEGSGYVFASVSVGNKGKAKAVGYTASGVKFSASGQFLLGKEENCVNFVSKNSKAPLAFNLWFCLDQSLDTEGTKGDSFAGRLGPLASGSSFICDYLDEPIPITITGNKWTNSSSKLISLKLSYKDAKGTFKGSFNTANGKATVNGVVVEGIGYGSATIKSSGSKAVLIK